MRFSEEPHFPKTIDQSPWESEFVDMCLMEVRAHLAHAVFIAIKQIEAPFVFDWETHLLWTQCRGIGPHLSGRGKSHRISRGAAGTWDTDAHKNRSSHDIKNTTQI